MIVILEGVDGGGKSTLAHRLVDAHDEWKYAVGRPDARSVIVRATQPEPGLDAVREYELGLDPYRELIRDPAHLVVCDRWHVGELVYGPLYRDESRLDEARLTHVELFLRAAGALPLLVQPPDEQTVVRRLELRGEDFLRPEHLSHVHAFYEAYAARWDYRRAHEVSWRGLGLLLDAASEHTYASRAVGGPDAYVGAPQPAVLLAGDRRGDGPLSDELVRAPLTPLRPGSSAHYLLRALLTTSLSPLELGLVNANDPGVDLPRLWQVLGRPPVVALGVNAHAALSTAGVPAARVHHPQFARRFRYRDLAGYGEAIETATREQERVHT